MKNTKTLKTTIATGIVAASTLGTLAAINVHAEESNGPTQSIEDASMTDTMRATDSLTDAKQTDAQQPEVQKPTSEKLADAQSELDQTKVDESAAQKDFDNKQNAANETKAPVESTISENEAEEQKAVDENQKGLDDNSKKLDDLQKQKEELTQKQNDLQKAQENNQKALEVAKENAGPISEEDYNTAKTNLDAAQQAYDTAKADLDAKLTEKEQQTANYNQAVSDEAAAKSELDGLTAKQAELEKNLTDAQAAQKEAQDAYDLITTGEQGEKYKEAVKSLDEAKAALENANQKVQEATAARDAVNARIAELNQTLAQKQSELASIASQQQALDQAVTDAQNKLSDAQNILTEKQQALTKAQADYDAHVKAHQDLYDDLAKVQAELDAAQKDYEQKKAAYDAALATDDADLKAKASEKNAEYDKGYAGFITWLQQKTGKDFSAALKAVNRDEHTDATKEEDAATLQHVKDALLYLKYYNNMRKSLGLNELKVSPYAMAVAINNVNTTRTQHLGTHTGYLPIGGSDDVNEEIQEGGENLLPSYGDPKSKNYAENAFDCWYIEKASYDAGVRTGVGHYLNMINPKWTVTGASFAGAGIQNFGYTLSKDPSNAFTVDEFENLLDEYWNGIAPEKLKYYGINLAINTAKQEYDDATDKHNALELRLGSITIGYDTNGAFHEDRGIAYAAGENLEIAVKEAQSSVDTAQKAVDSAQSDLATKQQAADQNKERQTVKQDEINKTNADITESKADLSAKENALTNAVNTQKEAKKTVSDRQKSVELYGATLNTAKTNLDKAKAATADAQTQADANRSKVVTATTAHNAIAEKAKALKASLDKITSDTDAAKAKADTAKADVDQKASVASDLRAKLDAIIHAQKDLDQTIADIQTTKDHLDANENDQNTTKNLINQFEAGLNTHKIRLAKIQKAKADLASITADSDLPWESDLAYSYGDDTMDSLMPAMTEYRNDLKAAQESKGNLDKANKARKKAQDKYNEIKAVFDREEANKKAMAAMKAQSALLSQQAQYTQAGKPDAKASVDTSDPADTGAKLGLFEAELAVGLAGLGMILTFKKRNISKTR